MDSYVVTALMLQDDELVEGLAEVGRLDITQHRDLLKAHELQERARVGDVAVSLSLSQNVTSQSADRLEMLGLVKRVPDASDRRLSSYNRAACWWKPARDSVGERGERARRTTDCVGLPDGRRWPVRAFFSASSDLTGL